VVLTQRRVHRLKLRSSTDADSRHARNLVEDGLRTASFPAFPQNGLLLIRRLNLGKLSAKANSVSFSLRIEEKLSTCKPLIISYHNADTPTADIV